MASQNVEVHGENATEGSRPNVRRRIITEITPPSSPITRSQARCHKNSPLLLAQKIREMIARESNAHEVQTSPVSNPTVRSTIGENLPQNVGDPTPISGEQGSSQGSGPIASSSHKIRGPTRGIGLEKLTKAKGKKITINVSPTKGRPTDPIASAKLSLEIGLMVRHHLPKNMKFKDITEGVIEESLSRVEARFDIDLSQPHVKRVAIGIMKDRNRGERCKLHKYFKTFPTAEEARKYPPNDIDVTKWNEMCDYWTSPKFLHRLEVNKNNRGNKAIHSGGSKPFIVHHAEKGDPIEGYKSTHQKKRTNEWIQPKNESAYEEMKALNDEGIPEMEGQSENFANNDKTEIVTRVLGKKAGRLLGFGFGPRAEKSSSAKKEKELAAELEASRAENAELKVTIQDTNNGLSHLENMMNNLATNPDFLRMIQSNTSSTTETPNN